MTKKSKASIVMEVLSGIKPPYKRGEVFLAAQARQKRYPGTAPISEADVDNVLNQVRKGRMIPSIATAVESGPAQTATINDSAEIVRPTSSENKPLPAYITSSGDSIEIDTLAEAVLANFRAATEYLNKCGRDPVRASRLLKIVSSIIARVAEENSNGKQ